MNPVVQLLFGFVFILILLSSGLLALAGTRTLLRDLLARRGASTRERPDGVDLLIDVAMVLIGLAGAAGAIRGLGAF